MSHEWFERVDAYVKKLHAEGKVCRRCPRPHHFRRRCACHARRRRRCASRPVEPSQPPRLAPLLTCVLLFSFSLHTVFCLSLSRALSLSLPLSLARSQFGWTSYDKAVALGRARAITSINTGGMRRLLDVGSDGKMAQHVTDCTVTRQDGTVRDPFLIKTRSGGDHAKEAPPDAQS